VVDPQGPVPQRRRGARPGHGGGHRGHHLPGRRPRRRRARPAPALRPPRLRRRG